MTPGQLRAVKFTTVRFREGYAMDEVDAFLERAAKTLEGADAVTAEQVLTARFTPVRLRQGYAMQEVDEILDHLEAELAKQGRAASDG